MPKTKPAFTFWIALAALQATFILPLRARGQGSGAIDIGDRRQLFVDDSLMAREQGVSLDLHRPRPKEFVMVFDKPWEGSETCYQRIIRDGNIIRMYYLGEQDISKRDGTEMAEHTIVACLALSVDGIHWVRPDLHLVPFDGAVETYDGGYHWIKNPPPLFPPSKHNNIVWSQPRLEAFTPFKDDNPSCLPGERYKAVGYADPDPAISGATKELFAYKSPDGIHWSYLLPRPIVTGLAFDTDDNAFWDPVRKIYWCYMRDYREGVRVICVSTSTDFRNWTAPRLLKFDGPYVPALYTNQIEPYYRDPELLVGFPARYSDRAEDFTPAEIDALPAPNNRRNRMKFNPRFGTAITDTLFMTSHDGTTYHLWPKTFILPGPQSLNTWSYHDTYQSLGLIETPADDPGAANELSFYVTYGSWVQDTRLRRFTIRIDGFVSVHAPLLPGGEFTTKPVEFSGRRLSLNIATSSAGTVRVELDDPDGNPLPGYSQSDCDPIFGDTLDRTVTWHGRSDVSTLQEKPIRIRMFLSDADLYSLKFGL